MYKSGQQAPIGSNLKKNSSNTGARPKTSPPLLDDVYLSDVSDDEGIVATKIFEGFGEALFKEFNMGWEPVSIVHHARPGTCINHPLH